TGHRVRAEYTEEVRAEVSAWKRAADAFRRPSGTTPVAQTEVFGALNELMDARDVLVNAAGSMPGDLQALWRAESPEQYHLEYGYSCMGYEIPAAMGVRIARNDGDVVALLGD